MGFRNFNFPCIDHLREGVDYQIVEWDFATQQPVAPAPKHTPGTPCPPGEKVVFGVCRKVKQDDDWDSGNDTKQETELKGAAEKAGSDVKSNKAFESGGKKFGWAIKNGKPVVVEWGSVAGTKAKPNPAAAGAGAQAIGAAGAQAAGGPPKPKTPAPGAQAIGQAAAG